MEPITELVPSSTSWAALPPDLVCEISGRLRDAADFVRFHAVCRPWRETAPSPAAIRPRFLGWPLEQALRDDLLLHRGHGCDGVLLPRASSSADVRNWVASADARAAWFFTVLPEPKITNLLTGAIAVLPRFQQNGYGETGWLMGKSRGIVYSDGTKFLYSAEGRTFTAAILRPGDLAWTIAEKSHYFNRSHHVSAAYHDGKILVCMEQQFWFVLTPDFEGNGGAGGGRLEMRTDTVDANAMKHECSYVFESGNELMWATVMSGATQDLASKLFVAVHALVETSSGKMRWVTRDGQSLRDRALFLGSPASFTAANAGVGGGCAYFVFKCGVFMYNLIDGVAKLMERVPSGWGSDTARVWLHPHPTIAPVNQIREKPKARRRKGKKRNP